MRILRSIEGRFRDWQKGQAERRLLRRSRGMADEIPQSQWEESLNKPTEFYERFFHYFHTRLPESLREHRAYFETDGRGFGEKPFHVMWFLLFREFAPEDFLEIGVFRGQTLSLAALLARHFKRKGLIIQGISPFSPAGDSVSNYRYDVDYYDDTLRNFAHFSLPAPALLKAYSTDEAASGTDCITRLVLHLY